MGVGVGLQAVGVLAGLAAMQQQKKAYELEAQAYKEQADMAEIQADQQEVQRNRQLRIQLASLGTSMSSQGVALGTSSSVGALKDDEIKMAKADISSIRLMGYSSRRKYELSAAGSSAAGKATVLGGFSKTASQVYSIQKGVA